MPLISGTIAADGKASPTALVLWQYTPIAACRAGFIRMHGHMVVYPYTGNPAPADVPRLA